MTHRLALLLLAGAIASACSSSHEAGAAGDVASAGPDLVRAIAQDADLRAAEAAIDQGHPWRATQLMAPVLRDPRRRRPAALLVAARAAAGWDGWAEVDRLLAGARWIDTDFGGAGRELLTRSALERGADTAALTQASLALRDATDNRLRAIRLVFLARALERNNEFDSAAVLYGRAGETLRPVREWLLLRAAGNESDSAKRAKAFASVKLSAARPRIEWTEAQARERFSDALGAASRYAALGATPVALRLRLSVAPDSATRAAIKSDLQTFIHAHSGSGDAKSAVEVLDKGFTSLSPAEELVVARSAAVSGPAGRAIAGFGHALAQPGLLTPSDRIQYAQSLARGGRSRDALTQLAAVEGPLAAQAHYQRGRIIMTTGTADAARAAFRDVASRFPNDTAAASAALYLLADLTTDAGDDDQARTIFRRLAQSYPTSTRAGDGRFHAALIAFVHGAARQAAQEFDSLVATLPRSDEATAARYWSGRAWAASGDEPQARARWREIIAQQPVSYYATAATRRLGAPPWAPRARADSFPRFASVDSAVARIALLDRLGMEVEARFELEALENAAAGSGSTDRLLATAHAMLERGQPTRAVRLAQKLVDAGERDARAYRLLFPVLDRDELSRNARSQGLDPALVAGLIRQESAFNTHAVSIAGARGLMQVLPSVGGDVARALAFPVWSPILLFDADANLQIGTAQLATEMKQHAALPRVLAAYNAGGSRVARWATKAGSDDPEVFTERIPFSETRDYVRTVQRNADAYRALYGW
jgi:soluble lytic murein transglycosylase